MTTNRNQVEAEKLKRFVRMGLDVNFPEDVGTEFVLTRNRCGRVCH